MNRVAVILGWASVAAACGGSSSETPFPQAPLDPGLKARHDAVLAAERDEPEKPSAAADVSPKAPVKTESTR